MPTGKEADHTCNIAAIAYMKRLLRENSLYKIQHHVWAKLLYTISSKHQVSVCLDVLFYTFLLLGIHVSTTLITLLPATAAALRPQPTRRTSSKLVANLLATPKKLQTSCQPEFPTSSPSGLRPLLEHAANNKKTTQRCHGTR